MGPVGNRRAPIRLGRLAHADSTRESRRLEKAGAAARVLIVLSVLHWLQARTIVRRRSLPNPALLKEFLRRTSDNPPGKASARRGESTRRRALKWIQDFFGISATARAASTPMPAKMMKFHWNGSWAAAMTPPIMGPVIAPMRANESAQPVAVPRAYAG